jgi:hypothetical protein
MRVGLLILLVAMAGALSCGPTEVAVCGPDNCQGCCTAEGNCLPFAGQNDLRCGSKGATCRSCPGTVAGFVCSPQGTCVPGEDQGLECSAETCVGCCEGLSCVPYADQSASACGALGGSCASCLGGNVCHQGACTSSPPDAGTCGGTGQACCTGFTCSSGLSCQFGVCQAGQADAGTSDAGTQADAGTTVDAGTDAGTGGSLAVGDACSLNSECQSNQCRIFGFPGGYCTQACTTNSECGAGAVCGYDPDDASLRICLRSCSLPGTTSECRSAYVCEKRATPSGAPACVPGCNSPTSCGAATTCDSRGFCCGANGFACCEGTSCDVGLGCDTDKYCKPMLAGIGGACSQNAHCASSNCIPQQSNGSWPGGYCTQACASAACPSGSKCVNLSSAICMKSCPSPGGQSTCRSGYVCDLGWAGYGAGDAVCIYACTSAAECGTNLSCTGGFCCGRTGYRCCGGVGGTCQHGGTCGTNGYCQ